MHRKYLLIVILVLIVIGVFWFQAKKETTRNIFDNQIIVEKYIRENIKTLAPDDPVLGGSWYVVNVEIDPAENTGEVVYEDGHIQGKATFRYSVMNGEVTIDMVNKNDI